VSARSYLSIGDVLTLLRQEFPDITISKIRFLESQGLVNPERTPSGYRKFYEHDVERLRWVLRQQREHFLPLKVIKDRLEDGSAMAEAAAPAAHTAPSATGGNHHEAADGARVEDPVLVGHRVGAETEGRTTPAVHSAGEGPLARLGDGPILPGIGGAGDGGTEGAPVDPAPAGGRSVARASRPAATSHRRGADRPALLELVDEPTGSTPPVTAAPTPPSGDSAPVVAASAEPATGSASPGTSASGSAARRTRPTAASRTDSGQTPRAAKGAAKSSASSPPPPDTPITPAAAPPGSGGTNLSAEELATASGLDVTVLRELQEYGLLVATTVAGVEHFDGEALAVATAAAGFTRYGIEPRHLRLYKNAAEREAGFVEQVVLPLVRQRNPEARTRAHETAEELTQLGQQLRGSLLRTALGDLLNG
jgi:DNA-binding transcriptional MerR regulator